MEAVFERKADFRNAGFRPVRLMERLPEAVRADFESLLHASPYPANVVVFSEGDRATVLYVVLEGEVRLSIGSADGKHLSLRIARKGDIFGLAAVIAAARYNATAETLYPAKLACVEREALLTFLSRHPCAYPALMEELSRKVWTACEQLRTVALSHSAPEKLARLLLEWSENGQTTEAGTRIRFSMTHEQVGEFIGTSRETVTRTLANFKHRQLVKFEGSTLTIPDREALASYTLG